jgi:DNA polymerase III alpha subunit
MQRYSIPNHCFQCPTPIAGSIDQSVASERRHPAQPRECDAGSVLLHKRGAFIAAQPITGSALDSNDRIAQRRNIVTCSDAMNARDGRWMCTAGLVLVRQKPRSAKAVMFLTIEDETGPANVVVWPSLFERRRRIVLGASMMAIHGRIQHEGEVVRLVAQQLFDLSGDLSGLADRDMEFQLRTGRGDEFAHGSPGSADSRDRPKPPQPRNIFVRGREDARVPER